MTWGEMNPTEDLERDQVMAHQGQRNTPEEMSVRSQHLRTTLGYQGYQADCSVKVVKTSSVTILSFFLPYYTQIRRTAFFPFSPHPLIGLLYFYDLIWLTRFRLVASCPVRYSSDVVIRSLMYDTYLRATHTTTSSIRGVQIPIYLVSNTTDSLRRSVAVLKLYQ